MADFDFAEAVRQLVVGLPGALLGISLSGAVRARLADHFGDNTAKSLGWTTLNPARHLDLWGTFLLVSTVMFRSPFPLGWGRPVPVDPSRLQSPRRNMVAISLAGVGAELALAIVSALAYRALGIWGAPIQNFLGDRWWEPLHGIVYGSIIANLALAVFNVLPIPPLEGGNALVWALPSHKSEGARAVEDFLTRYGFLLLFVLVFTGAVYAVMSPLIRLLYGLLMA